MIAKTEAVVLKSIPYSETSLIVSAYSRELGRISLMARGARRPRSKFGSALQTMSHIQGVIYYKEGRDIFPLNEASLVHRRRNLVRDLGKIAVGLRVVELVRGLTQEHDSNADIFNLLVQTLDHIDSTHDRVFNVLLYFQLKLATCLGIEPNIDKASVESIDREGFLVLGTGEIVKTIAPTAKTASRKALRTFAIVSRADLDTICRMEIDDRTGREVTALIDAYFRYHFDHAYPDRSTAVLNRLREVS